MRFLARLAAACAVVVTVCLGPATAFAASGSPPPPASCFRADTAGDYPTCTLVHGAWVHGDVSPPDNPTGVRIAICGGVAVALLVLWTAVRGGRNRSRQTAGDVAAIPVQSEAVDLDAETLMLPHLLDVAD